MRRAGTPRIYDREYKADQDARMKALSHESWFAAAEKADEKKPRSDTEFRKGFIGSALPLYFASKRSADKARLQTDSISGMSGPPPIATEMAPAIAAALGVDLFPCHSGRGRLPRTAARRHD
jgi:hypothetical protein